jgi:hypothetical protein
MTKELSKFTLAGGVKALKHDDAIDILNQLSEIEKYVPSTAPAEDFFDKHNTSHIWADFDEDENPYSGNASVVF